MEYLSATDGRATAVSAAKLIDYPTSTLDLAEGGAGPRTTLLVVLGLLLAVTVGSLPTMARRALRRRTGVPGRSRGAPAPFRVDEEQPTPEGTEVAAMPELSAASTARPAEEVVRS